MNIQYATILTILYKTFNKIKYVTFLFIIIIGISILHYKSWFFYYKSAISIDNKYFPMIRPSVARLIIDYLTKFFFLAKYFLLWNIFFWRNIYFISKNFFFSFFLTYLYYGKKCKENNNFANLMYSTKIISLVRRINLQIYFIYILYLEK